MKKLSEGATAVTAVFLLLTTAITFFFSVNKQLLKRDHRDALEKKDDKYNHLLKQTQDEMRRKQAEEDEKKGILPWNDHIVYPVPLENPGEYWDRPQK